MIGIIDYGVGNIRAFSRAFRLLNMSYTIIDCPSKFNDGLSKIILPGVGSFDHAMRSLELSGMRNILDFLVLEKKIPTLGVCVGFQMFCGSSEEGEASGLGWIPGEVKRINFDFLGEDMPLPHMGWNKLDIMQSNQLTNGIDAEKGFYFLHSYQVAIAKEYVLAYSNYGHAITSICQYDNIYGIQPHPEKSHFNGLKLLENFGSL
jgi:glutamine amidotransferase